MTARGASYAFRGQVARLKAGNRRPQVQSTRLMIPPHHSVADGNGASLAAVGDDDSQRAETDASRRDGQCDDQPGSLRRVFGAFSFLKPSNPPEALALVVICSTLIAGGAAAAKGLASLFAGDPWSTRADRVCLRAGNAYLSVDGNPREQMRERVQITRDALADLEEIGDSVPIRSTLSYQSMLSDKRDVLHLMERMLCCRRRVARLPLSKAGSTATWSSYTALTQNSSGYRFVAKARASSSPSMMPVARTPPRPLRRQVRP